MIQFQEKIANLVTYATHHPRISLAINYLIVAVIFYFWLNKNHDLIEKPQGNINSFLKYLFPRSIRNHKSFTIDLQFFLLRYTRLTPLLTSALAFFFFTNEISVWFQSYNFYESKIALTLQAMIAPFGPAKEIAVLFITFLVRDFAEFYYHKLSHENIYLWQLHKVHHYSRQLNYFTGFRVHPLDSVFRSVFPLFVGAVSTCLFMKFDVRILTAPLDFMDKTSWVFILLWLREWSSQTAHTHFPVHFGEALGKVFITPAAHTVHHSRTIIDKNYGQVFSIWDVMFGTYKSPGTISEANEHFKNVGVEDMSDDIYSDFIDALWMPIRDIIVLAKTRFFKKSAPNPTKTD